MKPISAGLLALLQTSNFLIGDLYKFTSRAGTTDFFSALDVPVAFAGNYYKANSLRIEGLRFKLAVGLQVDEQQIKIGAYPGETLFGADFLSSIADGLLDGAYLSRSRGFWQRATGVPLDDYFAPPIGVVELSNMLVSEITKIGRTHVELTVKSPTKLLDLDIPRNYYSPGCIHTLYDSGCTLSKAAYATTGIVAGPAPGSLTIGWAGGIPNPNGPDGQSTYAQGRLLFTSGPLSGLQVGISFNDSDNMQLMYPLDSLPHVGDSFSAYPGCSKRQQTCDLKFDNVSNFRGFPYVPSVYISI